MKHTALLCFIISCLTLAAKTNKSAYPPIDPKNISIVRDSFGTPHIFAKTDAEVAYGLAWANAEDAFPETQDLIYTVKGFMGRANGVEGAKADFFEHAIGARKIVADNYEKGLTPEFKRYVNGYVQGLNAYAASHPEQVKIRRAFPITEQDVCAEYITIMSFLIGVQREVGDIVDGKYDSTAVDMHHRQEPMGSNAYAVNGNKSIDGKTYLCINPHMPIEGILSFYECHLSSDEGLDFIGNMFYGGTSNAMGTNKHLGWAFTWNYFDRVDVYRLENDPHHKLHYMLDGQSEKLEKRPVWLKVNWHGIVVPVRKMTYWSKYGMTLKSGKSDTYFSIKYPSDYYYKAGQQLYEMAKSENYDQFWKALRSNHAIALFNMVYADDKDNIFYLSHGALPDRKHQEYNWGGVLPGNTSETLWTDLVPMDSMPHVIDPKCGYVFNTNNNVYNATCEGQNDNPKRLPAYVNQRPGDNNRAETLKDFFKTHDRVSFDQFRAIKFEGHLYPNSIFMKSLQPLWQLDAGKYPDIANYINALKEWDRNTDTASTGISCFGCFIDQMWHKRNYDDEQFAMGFQLSEQDAVQYLRDAQQYMLSNFGSINVKWGSIHKLRRGNKTVPVGSFADMLSPSYPKPHTYNGKLEFNPEYGDTYTMFVKYGKNGAESIESLQPVGNSLMPDSPHYNDQMELFAAHKTKYQTFDRSYWMKHHESIYRPSFK